MPRIRVERRLEIRGNMSRSEIRRRVVEAFLDEEPGENYEYWYHVETLSDGKRMYLRRPTRKFNFDFKVEVEGFEFRGTHEEIVNDLRAKKAESPSDFYSLMKAIREVYGGKDVDDVLSAYKFHFSSGFSVELLLKLLKWFFILEDIYYWNYKGRGKLMEYIENSLCPRGAPQD